MVLNIPNNITLTPMHIKFVGETGFIDVLLDQKKIRIFLNPRGKLEGPKNLARNVSEIGYWGNGEYEVSFRDGSNLEHVISLVKQAFLKTN